MLWAACLLLLFVSPTLAQRPLGGSIVPSPGEWLMPPPHAMPLQPVPPLVPLMPEDVPALATSLDPIAQYVVAIHSLSNGAHAAAKDVADVIDAVATAAGVVVRHRHEITQAAPSFLRLVLVQALQM